MFVYKLFVGLTDEYFATFYLSNMSAYDGRGFRAFRNRWVNCQDQIALNGLRPTFTAWDKHRNPRPAMILGNYSIRSKKEVKGKFSILC